MEANPGLASRIPEEIEFDDYSDKECAEIFRAVAEAESYVLKKGCEEKLRAWFRARKAAAREEFGNARDVTGLFGTVEGNLIDRLAAKKERTDDDYRYILPEDIPSVGTGKGRNK